MKSTLKNVSLKDAKIEMRFSKLIFIIHNMIRSTSFWSTAMEVILKNTLQKANSFQKQNVSISWSKSSRRFCFWQRITSFIEISNLQIFSWKMVSLKLLILDLRKKYLWIMSRIHSLDLQYSCALKLSQAQGNTISRKEMYGVQVYACILCCTNNILFIRQI